MSEFTVLPYRVASKRAMHVGPFGISNRRSLKDPTLKQSTPYRRSPQNLESLKNPTQRAVSDLRPRVRGSLLEP